MGKNKEKTPTAAPSQQKAAVVNTATQFRGKVADPVDLPCVLSFLGRMPVMAIWESIICLNIFVYFFVITYEPVFAYEIGDWGYYLFAADLLFYFDLAVRLLVEIYRRHAQIQCTFFLIPFSFSFFVNAMIFLAPIEIIYIHLADPDNIHSLSNHDWLRMNRLAGYYRIIIFFSELNYLKWFTLKNLSG